MLQPNQVEENDVVDVIPLSNATDAKLVRMGKKKKIMQRCQDA